MKDLYEHCLEITKKAFAKIEKDGSAQSERLYAFARDYINDAEHFAEKGEYETALEAVAYAHGFVDAGVLAGFFKIEEYHLNAV